MTDRDAIKRRMIHALSIDYDCSDALYEIVMGERGHQGTDCYEDAAKLADRLAELLTAPRLPDYWPRDAEGEPVELGAEYEQMGKPCHVSYVRVANDGSCEVRTGGSIVSTLRDGSDLRRVKPDTWDALAEDLADMVDKAACGRLTADRLRELADRCERMGR